MSKKPDRQHREMTFTCPLCERAHDFHLRVSHTTMVVQVNCVCGYMGTFLIPDPGSPLTERTPGKLRTVAKAKGAR